MSTRNNCRLSSIIAAVAAVDQKNGLIVDKETNFVIGNIEKGQLCTTINLQSFESYSRNIDRSGWETFSEQHVSVEKYLNPDHVFISHNRVFLKMSNDWFIKIGEFESSSRRKITFCIPRIAEKKGESDTDDTVSEKNDLS